MTIMQTIRTTVALIATALGFGVCFVLLQRVIGADSPWLGLLLMFYFMGLAKIAQPLFMFRLPRTLIPVRVWETTGPSYERLGVYGFGKMLRSTPLRYCNTSVYLPAGRRDLTTLYRQAASAEAIHFWAMVLFTPYIVVVALQGQTRVVAVFLLIQLLLNAYPILHLRTLRGRLDRIGERAVASRNQVN